MFTKDKFTLKFILTFPNWKKIEYIKENWDWDQKCAFWGTTIYGLGFLLGFFYAGDGHKKLDMNATSLRASANCDKVLQVLLSIYSPSIVNIAFTFLL